MALLPPFAYTLTQRFGPSSRADEPAMWATTGRASFTSKPLPFRFYRHFHPGMDLAAPEGTPIHASEAGTVAKAGYNGVSGLRIRVRIRPGVEYIHGHLSRLGPGIAVGVRVARGQVIAYVGHSGGATGPHSHHGLLIGIYSHNPASFYPGGAQANDPRIKPL